MLGALGCLLTARPSAVSQAGLQNPSSPTPTPGDVVTEEALTCWWRTTAAAIRVGEPFSVVLTCSALNTPTIIVVPDESRLDPKAVQFPPFEVLGGARAPDLGNDQRRFLQYRYDLRVIADDRFGKDMKLPPLTVNYRIRSRSSDGTLSEGQDQAYQLPALSMRVLSTVAEDAADIRGGSTALFEEIDARSFRSTLLRGAGAVFFALSALALIATVVQLVRRRPAAQGADERRVPAWLVHRGVARAFGDVERARQASGWTPELVAQALAAMRMVAAYAVASPMTLRPLRSNTAVAPGTIAVPAEWSHRRTASASSPSRHRSSPRFGRKRPPTEPTRLTFKSSKTWNAHSPCSHVPATAGTLNRTMRRWTKRWRSVMRKRESGAPISWHGCAGRDVRRRPAGWTRGWDLSNAAVVWRGGCRPR
jgi:hypothetical protein